MFEWQRVLLLRPNFGSETLLQQALPRARPNRALFLESEALPHVATRYDKLAANFLAMIQLASMRLWLRAYESTV